MTPGTILLALATIALIGVLPAWPYAKTWGYTPTGTMTVLLLTVAALMLFGVI